MPFLERDGDVFVLYLGRRGVGDSENRLHPDWIAEVHTLLDDVEASEGEAALVTHATGKYFSNGLDTDWLFANFGELHSYLDRVHTVYTRLLTLPMATVAAINGHAFGAGAMLANSCDFRVMRADRGYYCLPEVALGMTFTVGMDALLVGRLGPQVALEAMTTGTRFPAADALARGIVDETAAAEAVLSTAVTRAAALAGNRGPALGAIKQRLHGNILAALATPNTPENMTFGNN